MHDGKKRCSRRSVLKAAAAAVLAPAIVPARVFGASAPSRRVTLGFIGVGLHGTGWNLKGFLQFDDAQVLAVCDVMKSRCENAQAMVHQAYGNRDCVAYSDWRDIIARKDIDAVMISTPDHWHVPMALAAIRAGKDVCCEKPTYTIEQGRVLSDTVKQYQAVFRTSTEDRSIPVYHRMAELVHNSRIGRCSRFMSRCPPGQSNRNRLNWR